MTLIGQYDIWVRTGAVSILGAILHADSRIHRVYAPSTHSLPSIRPLWNPYGSEHQVVDITISTCNTRIRMLRELSPKFSRIWDKKQRPKKDSMNGVDLSQRSFLFVSHITTEFTYLAESKGLTTLVLAQLVNRRSTSKTSSSARYSE